jgi:hypothetical protein
MLKLAAVLAAVVSLAGAAPLAGTAAGSSQTVAATADAFVNAASPDSNYGGDARLYTDGSPVFRSYLRFDLSGLAGRVVTKATLQIHAETDGATGETIEVRGADSSWTEDGITYENAPSPGAIIDSAGQVSAGSWVSLDVTPLVSANGAATFVVDSQDDTRIRFASRETSTPPRLVVETTAATPQPAFPIRAAFYYPWFPEAWNQSGIDPYTHYTPSLGYYDSSAAATITSHIHALEYGNFQAAIVSWWGQGTPTDGRFPQLLATTDSLGSPLKWAVYYEAEGVGNPSASQIASDLAYLRARYASDQAYLRVNGRFVVFAFADSGDRCGMADRWKQANDSLGDPAYVVLKVFSGYRTCASQPDGWHQYGAGSAEDSQSGYSFSISPGYWKAGESTPLLSRDQMRFAKNVADMFASNAPWQLVTTFNEWGEGTSVESASQWASSSGYGTYLDILHANGGATPSATAPSNSSAPTVSGTAQQGQTLTATTGTWSGTAPISYAYQWRRCDTAGATCTSISGATSQSYSLVSADVGSTVRVRVTASNSAGSSTADSSHTAVVQTAPASAGPCGTAATAPATWKHVIWIWMENHSYSQIIGSSAAPYLNQLANECGLATNYHGVAHPSLPNYIAATSGGTQGITDDNPPSSHPLAVASIFSQVAAAGLTWRSYEESMQSNCALSSSGNYAVKHNPAAYYTGIRTQCASWDVPMGTTSAGAFRSDLQNDALPSFSFVTPNLCNDMHDCGVSTGDAWLKSWVPLILSSPGYTSGNTVVVITWDEDDGSTSNQVATIVASPSTPAGTRSGTLFNHYSLLRTAEEQLGLPAKLGAAATATSMRSAFHY